MKRVILGTSASGTSVIEAVTPPPAIFFMPDMGKVADVSHGGQPPERRSESQGDLPPGSVELCELFGSAAPVPTVAGDTASTLEGLDLNSPAGGFKMRIATYGANVETTMHATDTFDIDVVISGEITIMTEDGGEVLLKAGDSVVIPGVAHNWRSGPEGCRVAFLMIGAERHGNSSG
jgi:mannose-6-phosphate isomerase-like protein (cupin superfamily)